MFHSFLYYLCIVVVYYCFVVGIIVVVVFVLIVVFADLVVFRYGSDVTVFPFSMIGVSGYSRVS